MGNRVLLADDSITIQKVVGIIFANEDYDLTVVDNGGSAVDEARANKPDVMLVDAIMPGKSGYEVCEEIRNDPLLGAVPILLMTGAFEPFDEEKARRCGADDFISKPFESQQLVEKVKSLLELGKSRAVPVQAAPPAQEPAAAVVPPVVPPVVDVEPVPSFEIEFEEPATVAAPAPSPVTPEPPAVSAAPQEPEPFAFEVEEASPSDDLWGAFELEDEITGEDAGGGGQSAAVEAAAAPSASPISFELEQSDDFAPEPAATTMEFGVTPASDEFVFTEEEEEPVLSASSAPEPFGAPPLEESFVFGDEVAAAAAEPYGTISETAPSEEFVSAAGEFAIPPVEAFSPVPDEYSPNAGMEPLPEPPAVAASPAGADAGGAITMTEEQLAAAISRISREVIERIAWEVVPDLAETLIKEEIRRIKEGG